MEKSKVAVVACPDYEPARVKESLQKGLEAIGGLESLIGIFPAAIPAALAPRRALQKKPG